MENIVNNNLEEMTNNEIIFQIKQMQADYEALKLKAVKCLDEMIELDKKYDKANKILNKRLKP